MKRIAVACCLVLFACRIGYAQVGNFQRVIFAVDARTIASNGGGTPATLTLTPTGSYVTLTCNDPDGCTITMGETGIPDGMPVTIVNVSANPCTFADSSGVVELPGAVSLSQWQALNLQYVTDRWIQSSGGTSDLSAVTGTLAVANGGTGATSFTANVPIIGGGGGSALSVGTRSGNTTKYVTGSGSFVSGNCAKFDVNGNVVDNGGVCGSGGSSTALDTESGGEQKITDLSADTAPTSDDLIVTVDDPGGTPVNKKVTLGAVQTLVNKSVQTVNTETGAVATGSTTIPFDDSIPTSTEGDEYMTLAITPTNTANKLRIDVVFIGSLSLGGNMVVALYQDSGGSALAVADIYIDTNTALATVNFTHYMTAGSTSSTTFKVRAGGQAGTLTFNGQSGSRKLGGVLASSITITEIVP